MLSSLCSRGKNGNEIQVARKRPRTFLHRRPPRYLRQPWVSAGGLLRFVVILLEHKHCGSRSYQLFATQHRALSHDGPDTKQWTCANAVGDVFEHLLSTDRVSTYKPDGRAYQMGVDAFRLQRSEILFAAWGAAGAKQFGPHSGSIGKTVLPNSSERLPTPWAPTLVTWPTTSLDKKLPMRHINFAIEVA